jgi:hypothetical protein
MPTDHGGGLNDEERGSPIRPEFRDPDPKHSVTWSEPRSLRFLSQNGELLAQDEIFSGQLELAANKRSKKREDKLNPTHAALLNPIPHKWYM